MHQGRFSCILASKYFGSVWRQRLYSTLCGDRLFKLLSTQSAFFLNTGHPKHCFKVLSTANQSCLPKFSSLEAVVAQSQTRHSVWKSPKMSLLNFGIFHQFFDLFKTDLSGNSVWPQALGFQKLTKLDHFWHFLMNFCPLKM